MNLLALNDIHESLGARMVPFANFNMPVEYSGVTDEHYTVRQKAGLFDVSHMGEFWVKGKEASDLLQYLTTNNIEKLFPGKAHYTCMTNGKGGIVDDMIIYHYENNEYMLVVNAANINKDYDWIRSNNQFDAKLEDASSQIGLFALQGPESLKILQPLTDIDLSSIKPFHFKIGTVAGQSNIVISNTGYTGAGGFELYIRNEQAKSIWNSVFESGQTYGIKPTGLAARDTLRLEAGLCLYGNDIDDNTSPIEAGLDSFVKFTNNNQFIDRDYLWKQKQKGIEERLTGFIMEDKGIPRHDYEIYNEREERIGRVTSGTMSPIKKQGIGMGYIKAAYIEPQTTIFIKIRNKLKRAQVSELPFVKL